MATAVVLIKAEMGQALKVAAALRKVEGIKSAYAVTGPYDVVVTAEGRTPEALTDIVVSRIQKTTGVKDTMTCVVVG